MRVLRRLRSTGTSYTCRQYILAIPILVALTLAGRAAPGSDNDLARSTAWGLSRELSAEAQLCFGFSADARD
jgi:hypothetical protein